MCVYTGRELPLVVLGVERSLSAAEQNPAVAVDNDIGQQSARVPAHHQVTHRPQPPPFSTSQYSNGSDSPHRSRRADRSIAFARWCRGASPSYTVALALYPKLLYRQGEVTSQSQWSGHHRQFVGMTRYNALG